jgi:hypothetical protein
MIEDSTRSLSPGDLERFTDALSAVADEVFIRLNDQASKAPKPR